jgi:DNA-binding IclR family transcriptional regulator
VSPDERRIQVLERAFDLLTALAEDGPMTLTELVRATGLPKGTVYRLLASLTYRHMLIKDPTDSVYMLGPGFLRLMQGSVETVGSMTRAAREALEALRDATGETVILHVRMAMARVCVEELPSREPIRYTAQVGAVAPLHVGSASRVLLAFAPEEERERVLEGLTLFPLTPLTVTELAELRERIALTRERGWAQSAGERVIGASAISVPVHGPQGTLFSLSVLGPADRWAPERQLGMLEVIQDAAVAVATALAGGPSTPRRRRRAA